MQLKFHTLTLVVCAGALLYSCSDRQALDTHLHSADEWPANAQTVYSEQHQLFFENEYAVIGRETGFALHVSNLDDGTPRTTGSIEINLKVDDQHINRIFLAPNRPGIYLTHLAFDNIGSYSWTVTIDGVVTTLNNVVVFDDEHNAVHAAEDAASESGITMLKEQQWPIRLLTEQVKETNLAHQVPATARVSACKTHTAKIIAPLTGNLLAPPNSTRIILGQQVKAGELLAVLRIPLLGEQLIQWQASKAEAIAENERTTAALAQATAALERVQKLHAQQAKSQRELEEALYQHASAVAAQAAASTMLKAYSEAVPGTAMDLKIFAPISGQIINAPAASGEWVGADSELFQLQDLSQLHIAVRVPEADLPYLATNLQAQIPHPSNGSTLNLPGSDGKLLLSAQKVDPQTHSAEVIYEILNPGWLRPGMTMTAQLATGEEHRVMSIPLSAIVDDSGINIAFVQSGGENFARRALRLGHRDGQRVEILEGLALGERVVIDGAYVVHLTALSGTIPVHSH
ncbi:MAG: cobalt-zinc-cadmium efflux system membrane fusion protein [Myxococcota bacterium]|jgi:cobalt-zinc-cadmium efflux system membrane fusion protein